MYTNRDTKNTPDKNLTRNRNNFTFKTQRQEIQLSSRGFTALSSRTVNKHKNPQNSRRNFGAEEKKAIYQQKQASESLHGQNGGLGEDSLHGRAKEAVKYDGV